MCFKAVWLDRIPIINAPPSTPGGLGTRTSSHATTASAPPTSQELTTALVLRLREVRLDVDLGQSITSIQLDLRDAILRTRLMEEFSELCLSVSQVTAIATGNITGQITVPNFLFQTIRKERYSPSNSGSRLLDLQMTSGPLVIDLDSEYQKLLVYRYVHAQQLSYSVTYEIVARNHSISAFTTIGQNSRHQSHQRIAMFASPSQ